MDVIHLESTESKLTPQKIPHECTVIRKEPVLELNGEIKYITETITTTCRQNCRLLLLLDIFHTLKQHNTHSVAALHIISPCISQSMMGTVVQKEKKKLQTLTH